MRINYRLSVRDRYPTPVHDVLAGYDWVLNHLVPHRAIIRRGRSANHTAKIGVCGELIGGGLASMLALTECRPDGPHIAAAAVNEPFTDWIFPEPKTPPGDPTAAPTSKKGKRERAEPSFLTFARNGILNADDILKARRTLFRNAEDYFDPFASPILFFRTAGASVPPRPPINPLDEFAELAQYEREDFAREQLKLSALSNLAPYTTPVPRSASETEAMEKSPRKSFKRFPPAGSGLRLPDTHIIFGDTSPLSDQAVELAMLMRRAIFMQDKRSGAEEAEKAAAAADAELRISVEVSEGIRLWSKGQTQQLVDIGRWFGGILR